MGMMENVHAAKSRVVTTLYAVLKINEDVIKDDEKLRELRDAIKVYSDAARSAEGAVSAQCGVNIDKEKDTGEMYIFDLYASPAAMDSHIGKVFNVYANKILPNSSLDELYATTGVEDMEFWVTSLTAWQARIFDVSENVNDPETHPFADPTIPTTDDLVELGLEKELAENCVDAMTKGVVQGGFTTSKHRCAMVVIFKIKDEVLPSEIKMGELKQLIKDYGDCSRTTTGKLACEIAVSEKFNKVFIHEHFDSTDANLAHIGRCLKIAVKLYELLDVEEYVVSCSKEDVDHYRKMGENCFSNFETKRKMVVMERI